MTTEFEDEEEKGEEEECSIRSIVHYTKVHSRCDRWLLRERLCL